MRAWCSQTFNSEQQVALALALWNQTNTEHRPVETLMISSNGGLCIEQDPGILALNLKVLMLFKTSIALGQTVQCPIEQSLDYKMVNSGKWATFGEPFVYILSGQRNAVLRMLPLEGGKDLLGLVYYVNG